MASFFKHVHALSLFPFQPITLSRCAPRRAPFYQFPSLARARCLSFTHQRASKKPLSLNAINKAVSKTTTPPPLAVKGASTSYQSFADVLSSRSSPILLYQGPSRFLYIVGSHILGGLCLSWAGFNFYMTYLYPIAEIDQWISIGVGFMCILMTFFGGWFIMGPYRIIRTITALPSASGPLLLRLDNASMFPFFRPKSHAVPHTDVILSERLLKPEMRLSPAQLIEARRYEAEIREMERSKSILTLPFRQAAHWTGRGFGQLKEVMWKEGFIYMTVKGKNGVWKLDKSAAWALDNGRALDRLVKHRFT